MLEGFLNTIGYTKLSASILTSTIWVESDQTLRVWITLLALCDRTGFVSGTIPGLANVAKVSTDDCRAAIAKFLGPDPDSRTKENQGRRIKEVDGGWHLLNFLKYRGERDLEVRRLQNRLAKQRERDRQRMSANVSQCQPASAQAKAEAKAEAKGVRPPLESAHVVVAALLEELGVALYNRAKGQRPTYAEEQAALEILKRSDWRSEKEEILKLGRIVDPRDRPFEVPKSLLRLLEGWSSALDVARTYQRKGVNRAAGTANQKRIGQYDGIGKVK